MLSASNLFDRWDGKRLSQLLALFVAIALTPSMLPAQEWDHINGRGKLHDPTGVWLLRLPIDAFKREFLLVVFHQGGTLAGDFQGESAFDPSAVPLPPGDPSYNNNVISSPSSGVWQKTGWNTFAGMFLDMEYHNAFNPALSLPPDLSVFQFGKLQFTGRLSPSGDAMTFNALLKRYNPQGENTFDTVFSNATGTRIPLEILPKTSDTLPIPPPPQ